MIKPSEIQKKANAERVRDTQIEKDYILTWILTGVSRNTLLYNSLAFKGGTLLKKFYFEDYRYSEDLDFTLTDDTVSNEAIQNAFNEVFEFVREETNIPLAMEDFGIHETGNINFYISYIGPLGGTHANKKVKVDISRTEHLCFDLEDRPLFDSYSDQGDCNIRCYSLKEAMADLRNEFEIKARHKGLDSDSLSAKIDSKVNVFKSRWENSMKDQIAELPPFEQVHRELGKHFRLLFK